MQSHRTASKRNSVQGVIRIITDNNAPGKIRTSTPLLTTYLFSKQVPSATWVLEQDGRFTGSLLLASKNTTFVKSVICTSTCHSKNISTYFSGI